VEASQGSDDHDRADDKSDWLDDSRVAPSVTPEPATTLFGTAIMLAKVNSPLAWCPSTFDEFD
jgi:hypothetical protein